MNKLQQQAVAEPVIKILTQPLKLLFPLCFFMLAAAQTKNLWYPVQSHFGFVILQKRNAGERTSHFHIIWLQIFRVRRVSRVSVVLSNWYHCMHPSMCLLLVLLVDLAFWPIDHLPLSWCNVTHVEEMRLSGVLSLNSQCHLFPDSQDSCIHWPHAEFRPCVATVRCFVSCLENSLVAP